MARKLWAITINDEGWLMPASTAHTAINRLMSAKDRARIQSGTIHFRRATKEELAEYLKNKGRTEL